MKDAKTLYYEDIIPTLDAYHYYSKEEVKENEDVFVSAVKNKDINFINHIISLFDEDIEEEKKIVDNIKYLIKE